MTEQDNRDWSAFAQTVAPLAGHAVPALAEPQKADPAPQPPVVAASRVAIRLPPPTLGVGDHPAGLDTGTWTRFRTGRLRPARTLDLHGRTAQVAHHALHMFLLAAHGDRVRCVEIITGRGTGEAGGVIRRELPLWLNLPALRPLVLAASHPHAANVGAVRLLLRRVR